MKSLLIKFRYAIAAAVVGGAVLSVIGVLIKNEPLSVFSFVVCLFGCACAVVLNNIDEDNYDNARGTR